MHNSFHYKEKNLKLIFSNLPNFDDFSEFLQGFNKFNNIKYIRNLKEPAIIWQQDNVKLLYIKGKNKNKKILFIPSIINKYYILDLKRRKSLARFLSKEYSVYILDWGEAHPSINCFEDYINIAVKVIKYLSSNNKITILGYCLGGLISVAASILCKNHVNGLALLATPWDFSKLKITDEYIPNYSIFKQNTLPLQTVSPEFIQSIFFFFQTTEIYNKFIKFNKLKNNSAINLFVAVENWVKDGNSLSKQVIYDLIENFSIQNIAHQGKWFIQNELINLNKVKFPVFIAIPTKDKIVPAESTIPIIEEIKRKTIVKIETGHIGMIIGRKSKQELWLPLNEWLNLTDKIKNKSNL